MDTKELVKRIKEVCGIEDRSLVERIRERLKEEGLATGQEPFLTEAGGDSFYLPIPAFVLIANTKEEFDACKERIFDASGLKRFVQQYNKKPSAEACSYMKLIEKLLDYLKKQKMVKYEEDEENAEKLATIIEKLLSNHIKKIAGALYNSRSRWAGAGRDGEFFSALIEEMNSYLSSLGVYTMIARVGAGYEDIISYYDVIVDHKNVENKHHRVIQVDCPAYAITYVDKAGDDWEYCSQGKCILD